MYEQDWLFFWSWKKDLIIFDTENGKLIELNESGNFIISIIKEGYSSKTDIYNKLINIYPDSSLDEIKTYVDEFVESMGKLGYLE